MGRRAAAPVPGKRKSLPVKLPDDLALDLWVFCELHHGAPHNRIVEKAVRKFIDDELNDNPPARQRFEELKSKIVVRTPLQIVRMSPDGI
ncbi:MAG: hypothetical protein LAN64_06925 [Acidobacteriia bacterium]|nr:hypothetical protein [Terriglobia bacterium]